MAITGAIPLPGSGMSAFSGGVNNMLRDMMERQKMAQQQGQFEQDLGLRRDQLGQAAAIHADTMKHQAAQEQLWNAQQQKALQEAAWTQMLMGGSPPGQSQGAPLGGTPSQPQEYGALRDMFVGRGMPANPEQGMGDAMQSDEKLPQPITPSQDMPGVEVLQPGNSSMEHLNQYAGFKGIPKKEVTIDSDGNMITSYPNGMITKQHVAASASEKKLAEGLAGADAEVYKDMQKQAISSLGPQRTYGRLSKVLNDPEWKAMSDSSATQLGQTGRRLNLAYYKNAGTDKQKDLIGRAESLSGELVTQMAQVFKGPFRVSEQGLIEKIKPRPEDPLPTALAKLNELQTALDLETKVSRRTAQLMANEKMGALDAFERAKQEVGADAYVSKLESQYGDAEGTVRMMKDGELYDIPADKVSAAEKKEFKRV